jgi:threonine dehydratase
VFLKAECLQRAGSFKIRGAYNTISRLSEDEKRRGVVTGSAGNHAQAVALAARLHNIKATIVLPEFAPLTKVMATRAYGAEAILHGKTFDEAVVYSRELGQKHGYTYVHAFDDPASYRGAGNYRLRDRREVTEDDGRRGPDRGRRIDFGYRDRGQEPVAERSRDRSSGSECGAGKYFS